MLYGFKQMDEMTDGMQPGEVVVVAGRQSIGKTSFVLNVAANVARWIKKEWPDEKIQPRISFFSTQMGSLEILARMPEIEEPKIIPGIGKIPGITSYPIYLKPEKYTALDTEGVRKSLIKEIGERKILLAVVDCLQDMKGDTNENAIALKALAAETGVPMILVSLLLETDKTSELSNLPEVKALADYADTVLLLDETPEDNILERIRIIVAKTRKGKRGTIVMNFDKGNCKFTDLER